MTSSNEKAFLRRADEELTDLYAGVETRTLCDDEPEGVGNTLAQIEIPTVAGIVILSKMNDDPWQVVVLLRTQDPDGETRSAFEAELAVAEAQKLVAQLAAATARAEALNHCESV